MMLYKIEKTKSIIIVIILYEQKHKQDLSKKKE